MERNGGPTPEQWHDTKEFGAVLAEHGDTLLYGSKKRGESAALFNRLAKTIAVLAFVPGGISIMGAHYESTVRVS